MPLEDYMGVIVFLVTVCVIFGILYKKGNYNVRISTIISIFQIDNRVKLDLLIAVIAGLIIALFTTIANGLYKNYRDYNPNIKINETITSWLTCELDNGERCVLFDTAATDLVPYYTFDIQNNSEKPLNFNDSDTVSVDLLEFIPYDELNIAWSSGGADGWINPTEFELNLTTQIGKQFAVPFENGNPKVINGGYISIDANQMDRFMLKIFPEEKGYYRFTITLNYIYNNKKHSHTTNEYRIVCEKGLSELSKQRVEEVDNSQNENASEVDKIIEDTYEEAVEGQWLLSSEETYNDKGYILEWKDYIYDENNLLLTEITYDDSGTETLHRMYTYDSKGNVLSKKTESNFSGSGWRCDNYDVFDYDEYGNLIQKSTVDNDNEAEILWYYTYLYQDGLLCIEQYHSGAGNDEIRNYTYDNDGNIILLDIYYEVYDKHTCIEYIYENGLLIKKHGLNSNDTAGYVSYEYDNNGNLIKETVYDEGPVYASSIDYEYDSYGNLIKRIDNEESCYTIYKYTQIS